MAKASPQPDLRSLLFRPNVSIEGTIGDATLAAFLEQRTRVLDAEEDLILELSTFGGDADIARRIALEIRAFRQHSGRNAWCVGKTIIYSAGITILAAFPRSARFLTSDAVLLVHERHISRDISLDGPAKAMVQIVRELLAELEMACRLEREGFEELAAGSTTTADTLMRRAKDNGYLTARQALEMGLVEKLL